MDDLISRQALIDAFEEEFYTMYTDDYNYMIKFFNNLPSAEPKKGKWIDRNREDDIFDLFGEKTWAERATCSECGFKMWFIEGHFAQYKYCPSCGTRMEESDG